MPTVPGAHRSASQIFRRAVESAGLCPCGQPCHRRNAHAPRLRSLVRSNPLTVPLGKVPDSHSHCCGLLAQDSAETCVTGSVESPRHNSTIRCWSFIDLSLISGHHTRRLKASRGSWDSPILLHGRLQALDVGIRASRSLHPLAASAEASRSSGRLVISCRCAVTSWRYHCTSRREIAAMSRHRSRGGARYHSIALGIMPILNSSLASLQCRYAQV